MKIISRETLAVSGVAQNLPSIPANARMAVCILEKADTATEQINARFSEADTPTALSGMPMGQLGRYDISGKQNLANFQIISADGESHVLNIQYS